MSRSYTMDPQAAAEAGQSNRINATGAYPGQFTRAEAVTSDKGTQGIEFSFVDKLGREAGFLSLWTYKADGTPLSGFKMLCAIMTCMKVREITPVMQSVEKWENGQKVKASAMVYPTIMNKDIGMLLAVEPYEARDGSVKEQMVVEGAYEVAGNRTAKNVLSKAPDDGSLAKWIASLKDRTLRKRKPAPGGYPAQREHGQHSHAGGNEEYANGHANGHAPGGFSDMDDDIPW